jgi:hypothetical protein
VKKNKTQLVEKGFSKVPSIDCNETFALVVKMDSIRLVLSIVASHHWEVHHMNVNSPSRHGDIEEDIYMD